jgi:hypothetical protein
MEGSEWRVVVVLMEAAVPFLHFHLREDETCTGSTCGCIFKKIRCA